MKLLFPLLHNILPVKLLNQGVNSNQEVVSFAVYAVISLITGFR